ncbi:hypothetical protein [Flavobacterium sp.]|uniref:hypothetical protein n=1 Tax=Flavobacterium sp. TaxID=239 RepID=UPI002B4B461B|nr:hypothetical protein [Flavobacterium sp.]HLP64747.1 hypothetical protein [Flavobacterium sp.]
MLVSLYSFLMLLLVNTTVNEQKAPTAKATNTPKNEIIQVKIIEENSEKVELLGVHLSVKDVIDVIISILTLLMSLFVIYQIVLTKKALTQNVTNRNLSYLTELDRFLITNTNLWQFYDVYYDDAIIKINDNELRGLIYYKLNHFEITLNETNLKKNNRRSWSNYMIYCLQHSRKFREEVESILLEKGYKGLFGKRFILKLALIYKEAINEKSDYNTNSNTDNDFLQTIRDQIKNPSDHYTICPIYAINEALIDKIIKHYTKKQSINTQVKIFLNMDW